MGVERRAAGRLGAQQPEQLVVEALNFVHRRLELAMDKSGRADVVGSGPLGGEKRFEQLGAVRRGAPPRTQPRLLQQQQRQL